MKNSVKSSLLICYNAAFRQLANFDEERAFNRLIFFRFYQVVPPTLETYWTKLK